VTGELSLETTENQRTNERELKTKTICNLQFIEALVMNQNSIIDQIFATFATHGGAIWRKRSVLDSFPQAAYAASRMAACAGVGGADVPERLWPPAHVCPRMSTTGLDSQHEQRGAAFLVAYSGRMSRAVRADVARQALICARRSELPGRALASLGSEPAVAGWAVRRAEDHGVRERHSSSRKCGLRRYGTISPRRPVCDDAEWSLIVMTRWTRRASEHKKGSRCVC